jgi:hypothetical protein
MRRRGKFAPTAAAGHPRGARREIASDHDCPRVREVDIGQIFQDVSALVGAGNPGAVWGDRWQLKGLRETRIHLDREGRQNSRRRPAGHFLFVLWNQQMEMYGTRCVAGAMHSRHRILWDDREARVFLSRNTKVLSLGHNLRRLRTPPSCVSSAAVEISGVERQKSASAVGRPRTDFRQDFSGGKLRE